jgi:hypothetical protein
MELEIIVVDNDSQDDSGAMITARFPNVKWLANSANEGFGRANNLGIRAASHPHILLLNSDTLLQDQSVLHMVAHLEAHPDMGLLTCQLLNEDGTAQRSVFAYNASFREVLGYNIPLDYLFFRSRLVSHEIRAISGACILFDTRRLAGELSYFDPDFFMYSEEFEWCHRVRKAGFRIGQDQEARIYHLEQQSSSSQSWNIRQRHASVALLFKKNRGMGGYLLYLMLLGFNDFCNFFCLPFTSAEYRKNYFQSIRLRGVLFPLFIRILFGAYPKPLKIQM